MASTAKTTNYELSQFQNNDIPGWLTDYNGDMQKIDAGIHAAKTQAASAASGVSALETAMSGKQDKLTFDTTPLSGSTNPVTSGGIYNALQSATVQTDAVPTEGSTKPVQSGGVYTALQGKQNNLSFDNTPTAGSPNPVTSGGIYQALSEVDGDGWHSVTLYPFQDDPMNPVAINSNVNLTYNLPVRMKAGAKYEMIIENYGVTGVDATPPGTPTGFNVQLSLNGTAAGDDLGFPINRTGNKPFPQYTKYIFADNGKLEITTGNALNVSSGAFVNAIVCTTSVRTAPLFVNDTDANQITFTMQWVPSLPKYCYGVVFRYREVTD